MDRRPWAAVVNAAAYTEVDRAESDVAAAWTLNALAPALVAAETGRRGIPLLHLSTDFVFDGEKASPYVEDDPVRPLSVYGASKEGGEQAVRTANPRHVILRTAWVYSPFRKNFVRTMLRLAAEREEIRVVDDQRGSPTSAADLAAACGRIALAMARAPDAAPCGTYHCAGAGEATWCGLARAVFEIAGDRLARRPRLTAISTADYPTPARRPPDSRLDCGRLSQLWGVALRPWREALRATLDEILTRQGGTG
jgi:dTDP-4-dehydrorhamnose reductase